MNNRIHHCGGNEGHRIVRDTRPKKLLDNPIDIIVYKLKYWMLERIYKQIVK